jgi:hypothetical protein
MKIWAEAGMAYFNILSHHLAGLTEKKKIQMYWILNRN